MIAAGNVVYLASAAGPAVVQLKQRGCIPKRIVRLWRYRAQLELRHAQERADEEARERLDMLAHMLKAAGENEARSRAAGLQDEADFWCRVAGLVTVQLAERREAAPP